MTDTSNPEPKWPRRFLEYCEVLRTSEDKNAVDKARGQLWLILNSVLFRAVSSHAARYGGVPREDLEDIAAGKALELLNRIQSGNLDLSDREPRQLSAYLSSTADKGLMDLFRLHGREDSAKKKQLAVNPGGHPADEGRGPASADPAESRAYAEALKRCAETLENRARTIWLFRVFYEMSSKEISAHPEVRIKPSYVDVILQRVRESLRDCMRRKGHETHQLPTGVFVELWRAFRMEEAQAVGRA